MSLSSVLLALTAGNITGLGEAAFTDAGAAASATGRLRRNGSSLSWHDGTAARTIYPAIGASVSANGVVYISGTSLISTSQAPSLALLAGNAGAPSFTQAPTIAGLMTAAGFTSSGNVAITPAPVSGTPAQHGLFQENVVKGWLRCGTTGNIADSYNVTSITDDGTGLVTITWDRDFADTNYAVVGLPTIGAVRRFMNVVNLSVAVGSVQLHTFDESGNDGDPSAWNVMAMGDQ